MLRDRIRMRRHAWTRAPVASRLSAVALLSAAIVAGGCGDDDDAGGAGSQGSETLSVAIPTAGTDVLIHVASSKGYFEDEGLEVAIQDNTGANAPSLVTSGKADLALFAMMTPLSIARQGKPTSTIYSLGGGGKAGTVLAVPGEIGSLEDLGSVDDCRIATFPPGTSAYGYAAFYNESFDLNCDLAPLQDPSAQLGALLSDRADAIVGAAPNWTEALAQERITPIVDTRDPAQRQKFIGEAYPGDTIVFGLTDNLEAKRDALVRFIKGLDEARRFVQQSTLSEVAATIEQFEVYRLLDPQLRKATIEGSLIYQDLGSVEGFISKPEWDLGLKRLSLWGVDGYDAAAPVNSYDERVDMSYYMEALGKPEG